MSEASVGNEDAGNGGTTCSICAGRLDDPRFARNYPGLVCRACDAWAVNAAGERPHHESRADSGDNPVFVDGVKCWRRYRYGGYVTMRDLHDCETLHEFYDRQLQL